MKSQPEGQKVSKDAKNCHGIKIARQVEGEPQLTEP